MTKTLMILCMLLSLSQVTKCNTGHQRPHLIPNFFIESEPITINLIIKNSTDIIMNTSYPFSYSLNEPPILTNLTIPIYHNLTQNYTLIASIFSQAMLGKPLAQSVTNLTRYAKVRGQADSMDIMALQGVPAKNQDGNAVYQMHVPTRFMIMLIYSEYGMPLDKNLFEMFNIRTNYRSGYRTYIFPLDTSQMQIPFKSYIPIHKTTNNTHTLSLTIKPFSLTYYQLLFGLTNRQFLQKHNPLMSQIYTQQTIDLIKQTLFDNNFYLVVTYFTLSFIQTFMQIFAFKNQIEVWKKIQNKPGLSIQSLYQRLAIEAVVCLYLWEKDANKLFLCFQVFDFVLTVWKITKAVRISFGRENRFYIGFGYKQWYHNKVETADSQANHYTNYLIIILFIPFLLYKLYFPLTSAYQTYILTQSIQTPSLYKVYMFILQTSVAFILVFGFVMMTPQLYLNYKLKSVDHLPWKTLIYRFIYTIIDDIFVFMIDLPWLQRMFSFRDGIMFDYLDVIFVLYLVQRRIYRVDKNRVALSTGSVDLSAANTKNQQNHIKNQ